MSRFVPELQREEGFGSAGSLLGVHEMGASGGRGELSLETLPFSAGRSWLDLRGYAPQAMKPSRILLSSL